MSICPILCRATDSLPSSVSLPYISVFSAGQSTGQGAGQSTAHGADPDAGQSTDPDTGRGTGDRALELKRVLPSAWGPEVQRSARYKIGLGTPDPGTSGIIKTISKYNALSLIINIYDLDMNL